MYSRWMKNPQCEGKLVQGIKSWPKVVRVFLVPALAVRNWLPRRLASCTAWRALFRPRASTISKWKWNFCRGSPFYTVTYPPERERLNDTLVTTRGRRVYLAYPTSTRELIKNLSLVERHRWFRETFISQTVLVSEQISWTSCRLSRIFNFVPPTCSIPRKNRKFLHNIFPLFVKSIAFPISLTIQFMLPKNII